MTNSDHPTYFRDLGTRHKTETYTNARGAVYSVSPTFKTHLHMVDGFFSPDMAEFVIAQSEKVIQHTDEPVDLFSDWIKMAGYDSKARKILLKWAINYIPIRNRVLDSLITGLESRRASSKKWKSMNVAATNASVRMGVTAANLPLQGFLRLYFPNQASPRAYEQFQRALKDAIESNRRH